LSLVLLFSVVVVVVVVPLGVLTFVWVLETVVSAQPATNALHSPMPAIIVEARFIETPLKKAFAQHHER
jgi:hypothetical protein